MKTVFGFCSSTLTLVVDFRSSTAPVCTKCESLLLSSLLGKEDALAHFAKYHPAFDEAGGNGWLPLHKAAVQLNKNILEITLNGKTPFHPSGCF